MKIGTVLLDFGGVVAEEGFHAGLLAIGGKNGLEPDRFFRDAERIIMESGYLTGQSTESVFWDAIRKDTGITGPDRELRQEILQRFVLRPAMLDAADRLRRNWLAVAMLSDQTNWLEEIDSPTGLFGHFDRVFNSYRMHKSKRDASVFSDVCHDLGKAPGSVLFVDDNAGHIERAAACGLRVHHFTTVEAFLRIIERLVRPDRP